MQKCALSSSLVNTIPSTGSADPHENSRVMGNVTRLDDNHPVQKLATRQLAMKDRKFHSWFIYVEDIYKYGLEMRNTNAFPWPNLAWKTHVHTVVIAFWKKQLLEQASSMSSLAHLSCMRKAPTKSGLSVREKVIWWKLPPSEPEWLLENTLCKPPEPDIINTVDPTCPFCGKEAEDIQHLLLVCEALEQGRTLQLAQLKNLMDDLRYDAPLEVPANKKEWCMVILNGGTFIRDSTVVGWD